MLNETCSAETLVNQIVGISLGVGGLLSYIPQYWSIFRRGSHKGLSQLTLYTLNLSGAFLVMNALILNWPSFQCYWACPAWSCTTHLLPVYQIVINWLVVMPLYALFLYYKVRLSEASCLSNSAYLLTYMIVVLVAVSVAFAAKLKHREQVLEIMAHILGALSTILCCVMWLPQIVKLLQTQEAGSLSLAMFLIQTPGSFVIVIFQAVLFRQAVSTWISYAVVGFSQLFITGLLLWYKWRDYRQVQQPDAELLLTQAE